MLGAVLSTYINHPRAQQTPAYMMTVGYMALPVCVCGGGLLKQLSLKGISLAGLLGATTGTERKHVTDTHLDTTQRRSGDRALKSMELASLGMLS